MGISSLIYDSWMKEAQYKKYSGILPMLRKAGVDFTGRVLDVGIGTGLFEDYLKGEGISLNVSGVEIDPRMMREAQKKGYKVTLGSAEELPFQDETFDFVICLDTIHAVKDKERALSELLRVLRSGKHLLLSHYCNTFTRNEVLRKLESITSGLNVVDKKIVGQSDAELSIAFLIKK